jgi:peroxin-1
MPSKRKLAPVIGKEGLRGDTSREHEVAVVEVDSTFGKVLGLTEGQKVG